MDRVESTLSLQFPEVRLPTTSSTCKEKDKQLIRGNR